MRSIYGRMAFFAFLSVSPIGCRRAAAPSTSPRNDRNTITQSQLSDHRFATAYEAVETLRSNWLNTRGTDSFNKPSVVRVYLDNVSLGDKETLRTIAIGTVVYIRYFDAISASARWGLDHGAGVIFVSTRPASAADPDS